MAESGYSASAKNRFDLTGSVVWVPGGAGALGRVVSRGLAEHGAHVVIAGRSLERAETSAAQIRALGLSAEARQLDVADDDAVNAQATAIVADHGQLNACVNLAYRSTGKTFEQLTSAEWLEGLEASALGAFLVARAAGRVIAPGGSIVATRISNADGLDLVRVAGTNVNVVPEPASLWALATGGLLVLRRRSRRK